MKAAIGSQKEVTMVPGNSLAYQRNNDIVKMSTVDKKTLQEIGKHFNISRERVRQILISLDIKPRESGAFLRAKDKRTEKREAVDRRKIGVWGINVDELNDFKNSLSPDEVDTVIYAYQTQRANVRRLLGKNMWKLDIASWWKIWTESGKWTERGRGKCCLSRIVLEQPFSILNSEVRVDGEMIRDRHLNRKKKVKKLTKKAVKQNVVAVNIV